MKEKILALLIAQFSGVRKDGLSQFASAIASMYPADTKDETLKEVVGKITADQVNKFITDWRKDADAEVTKANQTFETGLRKKYDFTEKKEQEVITPQITTEAGNFDAAAFQKMFTESVEKIVKPLQEEIASLKGDKTKETRLQALTGKLNDCKDESLKSLILKNFTRMQFDTDEAFTEYLTETENDIKTANQNVADEGLGAQGRPIVSNSQTSGKEATDAELNEVMNLIPM